MRRMPIPIPFIIPNRSIASAVYCEQVGVKRQEGGMTCEYVR